MTWGNDVWWLRSFMQAKGRLPCRDASETAKSIDLSRSSRLSLCISTYNRAGWLEKNLESWARLYPEPVAGVELLVCDNASTDRTAKVVARYRGRADFSYRRNPANVGMLGNLREIAHAAKGDYIWIVGDDDLIFPGAIERVLSAIDAYAGVSLVYLNYANTQIYDARKVKDFERFFREAHPIVPPEPDRSGPIKTICARNENFFTAIYSLVFRRDHAIAAYSQDTRGRPFSTMLTCIPTTYYVLNYMMDEPGVWIGEPQVVVNTNVSWTTYVPLWILERIPEVYDTAEGQGVPTEEIDRWRRYTLPGFSHYFKEIFQHDPAGNAEFFSPARAIRRFASLPEFKNYRQELKAAYERAHRAGHAAAKDPIELVFGEPIQEISSTLKSPQIIRNAIYHTPDGTVHSRASIHSANATDPYHRQYQIDFLKSELEFVQRELERTQKELEFVQTSSFVTGLRSLVFLRRHIQQFYWTVTRAVGLGYLHDGSRPKTKPAKQKGFRPVLTQKRVELKSGPRILIDCTETCRTGNTTGIQRVVREVAKASVADGSALPVTVEDGQLISFFQHPDLTNPITINEGDKFLLLDSGWGSFRERVPIMQEVLQRGGGNIFCIYDLIPLLYPPFTIGVTEAFRDWLETDLPYCDAVLAISKSTAEDFINYAPGNLSSCKRSLRVGWFHLGADFAMETEGTASRQIQEICRRPPFFVGVGTLEPRKNYAVALDGFDLLWRSGVDVRYVIVGRFGWNAHALRDRILRHPEFGRRLFWLDAADDKDLTTLYRHAVAAIQPSIVEGFGLPIVEAAHFGTPVIASDIRIFREVGGESISYFDPMDPDALVRCIREALANPRVAPSIVPLTWKEATAHLLQLVIDEAYPYTLSSMQ